MHTVWGGARQGMTSGTESVTSTLCIYACMMEYLGRVQVQCGSEVNFGRLFNFSTHPLFFPRYLALTPPLPHPIRVRTFR